MKNVLFVLVVFALSMVSCNKNNDDNNPASGQDHLNPPAWIQGTWIDLSNNDIRTGYQFTTDDMLTIIGNSSLSVKESLQDTDDISEESTSSKYQFTITHTATNNSTETWLFNSIDDTHIEAVHGTVSTTLTKE